ncbi:MAG: hypothetical protein HS106_09300 [Ideonella sp.]|nr:MAG: hypothetical protein F9K36_01425 [Burkholderiaceae bacterium]MBE7426229.1 hypothetical protein [Ideonella sp.]
MGLMLLRILVMARLLDVTGFATYSAGLLVSSSFGMLACLGLHNVLQRELPVMLVRRRERAGAVLMTQCVLAAMACAACGLVAAVAGLSLAGLSPGLLSIGLIHGLSQQLFLSVTVESRSRGDPLRFARQNLTRAVLVLPIGITAAAGLHSAGAALLSEAAISLALAALVLRRHLSAVRISLTTTMQLAGRRLPQVKWRSALTLLAATSLSFLLINADRWIAAQWLQPSAFAQYAFAWTILMMAQAIQVVANASLFPLVARRSASVGAIAAFRIGALASLGLLGAGAALAWPLWWLLASTIDLWFPAYADARSLLPMLIVVALFRVSDFWTTCLIVFGRELRLLTVQGAAALCGGAIWWILQPSGRATELTSIAVLALVLASTGYAATALAAWLSVLNTDRVWRKTN